jgi:hypothetical protein
MYKIPEEKNCNRCQQKKKAIEFNRRRYKNSSGDFYWRLRSWCALCENKLTPEEKIRYKATKDRYWKKGHGSIKFWTQHRISKYKKADPQSDLTPEYLQEVFFNQRGCCYYTGHPMIFASTSHDPNSLSIDKLDPLKGYKKGNIVFCKFFINTMKSKLTESQFREIIRCIYFHESNMPTKEIYIDPWQSKTRPKDTEWQHARAAQKL